MLDSKNKYFRSNLFNLIRIPKQAILVLFNSLTSVSTLYEVRSKHKKKPNLLKSLKSFSTFHGSWFVNTVQRNNNNN